ncbi:CoA-binding protein [Flavobacterium oreochromis]|uniref:CoA-binding protein n=2 Tax=Flavobacterium TaxID=237 RepID=A0A246GDX1_9FLAO|nr:CoA-binding protein [Flavobacterium oreochromis]OWP77603.1 CoA-binding protein [Flavobacterium oreochromis]OWP79585.1 CoA-binding protein [Flavobacterium oreochromis]POR29438.1 CoA-binding protein [Flavobacterium columnare]QYS86623.1 CoA-binding protein [Flavobacterium oreochromis]
MKTLVLGASSNPERYSFIAMSRLLQYDHEVVAIGLKNERVFGIEIQIGFPVLGDIHTVTLYLNPQRQKEYYDYIIALKPKRVIFNPGTENPEFYELLKENHIKVEEACTLVLLSTKQY